MMMNLILLTGGPVQTILSSSTSTETAKLQIRITLFNTLSTVLLALTIIFAAAAVLLFFCFRIPEVYSFLSGKARDKKVREIQAKNAGIEDLSHADDPNYAPSHGPLSEGAEQTTLLGGGVSTCDRHGELPEADAGPGQTVLLTPGLSAAMATQIRQVPAHRFVIVKEEIEVHTDEMID